MGKARTTEEINQIAKAGQIVGACHRQIARWLLPGVSTAEIDRLAEQFIQRRRGKAAQKGYKGFPYAICASVNDIACHGFPDGRPLAQGDIVTIDLVVEYKGWMADSAWSYAVGKTDPQGDHLLRTAKRALYKGIAAARTGNRIGDIGYAIETFVRRSGCQVIPGFVGHGIGRELHEPPQVPPCGLAGTGTRLQEGMVLTIEPIVTLGRPETWMAPDGWAARTRDGARTAQFEHTIAITRHGPRILTRSSEAAGRQR
ncbi:type I methionyl aminopeptidase [Paenibacillus sp. 1P07SE]|uniref:type I methionyl aminopeptidase n=1 Tax=Paenibacillus sp. 1P07SE TaxID=3132209 RepID=UPI0039A543D3